MFYQTVYPIPSTVQADPVLGSLGEMTGQASTGASLMFIALYLLFGCTVLIAILAAITWMTSHQNEDQADRSRTIFIVALAALLVEFIIWRAVAGVTDTNTNLPVLINNVPTVIPE